MAIVATLIIVVVLGVVPTWPPGTDWGDLPTGALAVLLVVLLALTVTRRG